MTMTSRPSKYAAIHRHKTAVPPFAAPAHWLCLQCFSFSVLAEATSNVSEAEICPGSEYLFLRIRTDGEGDGLSRIRRPLAVRQGNQPDGHSGARHGVGRADRRTRRQTGDR